MGFLFAIIFSVLFVFSFLSLLLRLDTTQSPDTVFDKRDLKNIKESLKYVCIWGGIGCVLAWLNYYLWTYKYFSVPFIILFLVGFASVVCFFPFLFVWMVAPTESFKKNRQIYEQNFEYLNSVLNRYSIDKTLFVGKKAIAICVKNNALIIYDILDETSVTSPKGISIDKIYMSSIIDCEIIEDNATIMKGGIGRAIVGGAIAGNVGAIIGATTRKSTDIVNSLFIRIITNDIQDPLYEIKVISETINRNTDEYRRRFEQAQRIYATIIAIIHSNQNNTGI